MYPHEHGMELHNHGEGHTYLEPDWHASGHDAQLPALSTMGRGPRGEGLYIDNVVQEDGNVSFGLYSTLTKECVWQSPNLAAPKINFNAVDWHDLVPGEATPLDITVESDGTTKTTTAYLPSGQQGSLVYLYGESIERTAHDVYQVAADDLCIYGSKTYPAKPTPRVNDIVIFSWTKTANEYGFAFGTIEAVEEGQVVFTARTFVPGVPGDTWYGDPVTVEHGGTGHSNGNGVVWYGTATGTAVENKVLDIECTIKGYIHAVGNFLIIKLPNLSSEVQLNNLTIHSEDNDEGIVYKIKGVGVLLTTYTISPSVANNRNWILPLIVTADTIASSVNGAMFPNEPEFSRNLISTPNAFSHTTLEAAYSSGDMRYYASNIGINLERHLYDHIDKINTNYFDIVISNTGQNSAINNRGIYLRYRHSKKHVISNTVTTKTITAPASTVGLQSIFPNLSKSNELPYTMLAAVNITSDELGTNSYVLDQGQSSATVVHTDGTNVATIELQALTSAGVDAKVVFNDPGKLLTNATLDVVWCFLVAEIPYYERGVVSNNANISYHRCGHRVVIDFNKTLISDASHEFNLPASISPYPSFISGYEQTQLPYSKKYAILSSDVVNDDPDPSTYTKLAKVEIKVNNGNARLVVTPLTNESSYSYKLDYTFEYIV